VSHDLIRVYVRERLVVEHAFILLYIGERVLFCFIAGTHKHTRPDRVVRGSGRF